MAGKMLQIINVEGGFDEKLEPTMPDGELRKLYRLMVAVRALDGKMLSLQRQGRIGFYVPCTGQEAAHIGSAYALEPEDWIFPAYREPGVMLLRGISLKTLICQLMGNAEDLLKGRQMPNHWGYKSVRVVTPSSPIATQIPHAVGCALAAKLRGDKVATLVYFGDGATSEGDFHVGMNFAGVYKTPTIFLLQNNHWAISVPVSMQTATSTLAEKADAYGFEGVLVDGNDLLAVYKATKEAVEKARSGGGPTLIEAVTYRMGPHSTADDPTRYRSDKEVEEWRKKDPIIRFRLYLEKKGIWDKTREENLYAEVEKELNDAIKEAEAIPPPSPQTLFDDVYAEMPWNLREQMQLLLEELKSAGG